MLNTIIDTIPKDSDFPPRTRDMLVMRAALDGTLYDGMGYEFHEEKSGAGEYIPIRQRKPSVRYDLCRVVVEDSVSLLFSEGHFPTVQCADKAARAKLGDLVRECRLDDVMIDAAIKGSVGSVVVHLRILNKRAFFDVMTTEYLTPSWQPDAPDALASVAERYKVNGRTLRASGYTVADDDMNAWFWFARTWDAEAETWFMPVPVSDKESVAKVDKTRTVQHALGFVPMVWIKNLPGGNDIDGACTFRAALPNAIEIDYQLSQAGRGLKYSSDPTLLIKDPAAPDDEIIRGGGNAIIVSEKGDAKMLEIGGTASAAVVEYVRTLRELALEAIHGNRTMADKLSAATSGRAMELMNQGLIWLADRLRAAYGEHGLLPLLRMVVKASEKFALSVNGDGAARLSDGGGLSLKWPRWYQPTAEDRQSDASTLAALRGAGLMSRQTAIGALADDYDIEDVAAEILLIQADMALEDARLAAQAAAIAATEPVTT